MRPTVDLEALAQEVARLTAEVESLKGPRQGAFGAWEQWRPFFRGKTKLDGSTLQMLTSQIGQLDGAFIVFDDRFHPRFTEEPPANSGGFIRAVKDGTNLSLSLTLARDMNDYLTTTVAGLGTNGLVGVTSIASDAVDAFCSSSNNTVAVAARVRASVDGAEAWVGIRAGLRIETAISPAQIIANQNDYDPADQASAAVLRLSSDASRNITGLAQPDTGRVVIIVNVGAQNIVLTNEDAASAEANRFAFGANLTLNANEGVTLWYDTISDRWRCIGKHT